MHLIVYIGLSWQSQGIWKYSCYDCSGHERINRKRHVLSHVTLHPPKKQFIRWTQEEVSKFLFKNPILSVLSRMTLSNHKWHSLMVSHYIFDMSIVIRLNYRSFACLTYPAPSKLFLPGLGLLKAHFNIGSTDWTYFNTYWHSKMTIRSFVLNKIFQAKSNFLLHSCRMKL